MKNLYKEEPEVTFTPGSSGICRNIVLFHRLNNKLKRCLFYRNQILRQYTRAAGSCTYACLLGVQMDGDCTASSQLVYMCGGVYIAVAEGNQAELPSRYPIHS